MNIVGFDPSSALSSVLPPTTNTVAAGHASGGFGSAVKDAMQSLDKSQQAAEQEVGKAVTGESPDLHRTIIALQTADLNFQFALQVRNKVIDAYSEIMRMQV
jgi:flagellar hook-basal body complex protein FliE